jgi:putative ABC transport system permease protein
MKYFPLIWAALWRKPADLVLTLLSVTAAFTLFGIMIGFNAGMQRLVETSRPDLVYVYPRFNNNLPLAYREEILRLPGVAKIGYLGSIPGAYYQDKKNRMFIRMVDEGWTDVMTAWFPITPARWHQLQASPTGVFVSRGIAARYHLKVGDAFPILTDVAATRQDGGKFWPFTVIGILDDSPQASNGYVLGNYTYLDESRPLALRGTVTFFDVLAKDPAHSGDTAKAVDALFANSSVPTRSDTDREEFEGLAKAGINVPFVTMVVAGAGLFMILFLTANGIAQSVRERIAEFAMLKTLGFSDRLVMGLVFVEAAIPCLLGAAIGLGLATAFAQQIPRLMPPTVYLPVPIMSASVLGLAMASAALVALLSAITPVLRLRRLDVAAALAGR